MNNKRVSRRNLTGAAGAVFLVRRLIAVTALSVVCCVLVSACSVMKTTYRLTKGTVTTAYKVTKFAGKTVYTIGEFTFTVVMAPLSWPLTHKEIETIDGLSPQEAIAQGRVKASPLCSLRQAVCSHDSR